MNDVNATPAPTFQEKVAPLAEEMVRITLAARATEDLLTRAHVDLKNLEASMGPKRDALVKLMADYDLRSFIVTDGSCCWLINSNGYAVKMETLLMPPGGGL